jgi:glycosyltransferase involved in cell wall biosynthesis
MLSGLSGSDGVGRKSRLLKRLLGESEWSADRGLGYPTYRRWAPATSLRSIASRFAPTVIAVQLAGSGSPTGLLNAAIGTGVPVIAYIHDVEFQLYAEPLQASPRVTFLANSEFTRSRARARLGLEAELLSPFVPAERYRVESTRSVALFVNPHPLKGVEMVLALAEALPHIRFEIIESWPLPPEKWRQLIARTMRLPNVRLRRRLYDVRVAYANARVLLVPSQWEEAWGRVVSEAQVSGIPVLASDLGGLRESVGPGGMILPADRLETWVGALDQVWSNRALYEHLSEAARSHSRRAEVQPRYFIDRFKAIADRQTQEEDRPVVVASSGADRTVSIT